jgi:hypothetical protein
MNENVQIENDGEGDKQDGKGLDPPAHHAQQITGPGSF